MPQSGPEPKVVEWLRLSPRSSGVELSRHRVQDVGRTDFLDVYEFPSVDPDEEPAEGKVLAIFSSSAEAVAVSVRHGARADKWVNDGVVQDEYARAARI